MPLSLKVQRQRRIRIERKQTHLDKSLSSAQKTRRSSETNRIRTSAEQQPDADRLKQRGDHQRPKLVRRPDCDTTTNDRQHRRHSIESFARRPRRRHVRTSHESASRANRDEGRRKWCLQQRRRIWQQNNGAQSAKDRAPRCANQSSTHSLFHVSISLDINTPEGKKHIFVQVDFLHEKQTVER